jgi:K(+)-stimulated pyrophosphate-energized sodium pump
MIEFIIAAIIAVIGLIIAGITVLNINGKNAGNPRMQEISGAIREGAIAFLNRQYKTLLWFVLAVTILLAWFINWQTAVAFVVGAFLSALAGNIGMRAATKSNVRAAAAKDLNGSLQISYRAGTVMGLSIASLGILGIVGLYYFFGYTGSNTEQIMIILFGFGFGASSIGLFARVGGGIYTKAADVGADLVGKVEAGIPEDDPRNPAVIADNVGDNVGDVAGMGADLFESYVGAIIAAAALGWLKFGHAGLVFPVVLVAVGLIASVLAGFLVRAKREEQAQGALRNAMLGSSILVVIASFFLSRYFFGNLDAFWATTVGVVAGFTIGLLTEYYTSHKYSPTRKVAEAAKTGAGTNLIQGLALGMESVVIPLLIIVATVIISYATAGEFGIALAAVGLLATVTVTMAVDTYGAVADNAGGIAEMAGLPPAVRKRTDALDAVGNTTAAIGKAFSIASAALVSLALFTAFAVEMNLGVVNILNTYVIAGLLIGAAIPFLFSSWTMRAVGRAAFVIIEEVRRQFRTKKILAGKDKPDYAACVDIATKGALREMILPGLLVVIAPIAVGFIFGAAALAGMLLGAIASGILLAFMMANAGGSWDNAKKYIESGHLGGKGSEAHKAAVIGDTVGDPFKDTSGGSINIMVKLMGIVAILMVPLLLAFGSLL